MPRLSRPVRAIALSCAIALAACTADGEDAGEPLVVTTSGAVSSSSTITTTSSAVASSVQPPTTAPASTTASTAPPADPDLAKAKVKLTLVAELAQPVALAWRPRDPIAGAVYVAERPGTVRRLRADGRLDTQPIVDISDRTIAQGERGLLGLAFSPDGAHVYLHYTDTSGNTNLDVFTIASDGNADASSRRRVLFTNQPFANHNGGEVRFGPDGKLYLGLGDGGSGGDPQGNGQKLSTLLGKILRIEPTPTGAEGYRVPNDNPFVGTGGARAEIWSYGLRNPWRFSWDRATGDLWIGDVGQGKLEEVDVSRAPTAGKGVNFGWNAFEGSAPFDSGTDAPGAVPPFHEYARTDALAGCSVTGGYVYRGNRVPALRGAYVFADYCVAGIRAIQTAGASQADAAELSETPGAVVSFGEGADGELYVLSLDGTVHRIDPA